MPGRLSVGGIALVKNGKGGGEQRVAQILVELGELPGREEAFVDNGLGGKRADVTARGQERFGAFSQERKAPLETFGTTRRMEKFDEKLPDFRHRFERAAAERIGVGRNAAPADDAEALGVGGGFDGGAGFVEHGGRDKREADGEHLREFNSLLLGASAEESLRKRSEQAGAAGTVGINASTVGEALQGRQCMLDNVVARSATEAGNETGAAGVVIGMAPIGMAALRRQGSDIVQTALASTVTEVHTSLSNGRGVVVQRRILIH